MIEQNNEPEEIGAQNAEVDTSTALSALALYLESTRVHNTPEYTCLIHAMMANLSPENVAALIKAIPEEQWHALLDESPELEARLIKLMAR
ncbi:hypothetical protein J8F10_13545 [Gemmata sp. G18]|uniref:Magnesium transporter MgtE intracellular domain-containing protein n=1 Tax=Gemmata palustris TaxID=2822762 RepID=A0ABS5BRE9_9BACT|nr:hypothetical protein [Gemmata palustris]MBP3956309.1 hypothetical protein [Gemmata palustris]